MTGKDILCASFKLETDQNRIDERMESSLKKYGIDMVIGNIWGDKNWIKVKFNQESMGQRKEKQYDLNVETNIVDAVLEGWNYKFGK